MDPSSETSLAFFKYSGCGNDFIIIDNRTLHFPATNLNLITHLCQRSKGIGADGLILLENSIYCPFKMRIFNADGSEAEMCGNGLRCLFKFIQEEIVLKEEIIIKQMNEQESCLIETKAALISVSWEPPLVAVSMPLPSFVQQDHTIEIEDHLYQFSYLNTGVPHCVIFVDQLNQKKWMTLGKKIRHHPLFAPQGTNVNFASLKKNCLEPSCLNYPCLKHQREILIRTYERGVEGETQACGTGAVAVAIAAAHKYGLASPIKLTPVSQDYLEVSFCFYETHLTKVVMKGPARKIFHGKFVLN